MKGGRRASAAAPTSPSPARLRRGPSLSPLKGGEGLCPALALTSFCLAEQVGDARDQLFGHAIPCSPAMPRPARTRPFPASSGRAGSRRVIPRRSRRGRGGHSPPREPSSRAPRGSRARSWRCSSSSSTTRTVPGASATRKRDTTSISRSRSPRDRPRPTATLP
jgi:hypothetical protein